VSVLSLQVDIAAGGSFLFSSVSHVDVLGIFVRTQGVYPVGTHLRLRFAPPPGVGSSAEPFDLEGQVMWVAGEAGTGMGVQLFTVDAARRAHLVEMLGAIAYFN